MIFGREIFHQLLLCVALHTIATGNWVANVDKRESEVGQQSGREFISAIRRRERPMLRFRQMKTLQKFSAFTPPSAVISPQAPSRQRRDS